MSWKFSKQKMPKKDIWVLGYCLHWIDSITEKESPCPIPVMRVIREGKSEWICETGDLEVEIDMWHFMPRLPPLDLLEEKRNEPS
jgi:Iap family predicted aminopeptidase